ncbi:TRAP transporter small transmembrane protein [Roseivivax marinus]|uniref:TRAP transporter small permease protein n=1 Tax=Roseivivax marinus TaxID=1379903 RepID=W4HLB6_9RHOB|nr:TRAP transporter small permease subunit [Roseivivax marinus]ETW12876.1 TRAP transporter small transmembrane protein [Roseivivax marinus]
MQSVIRALDAINEVVGRIVACLSIVFAAIILYDVVMRYALNSPTRWAFDVTTQMYAFYFVMLGGYALKHQSHVRVDLVTETFSDGFRRIVEIAGYVIFYFPFTYVFLTRSWEFAARSYAQGETTYGAVQLPVYPLKMAMTVAAGLLLIQGISEVLKLLIGEYYWKDAELVEETHHGS